jgi:hypothetical protein
VGGWVGSNIYIYIRVPLNGMCKFSVSKINNNVFNAAHQKPVYFVWITKPSAFVEYVIKFVEEYVKNNKPKIHIFLAYLIPNLDDLSHRIKSYVVYIVTV